MHHVDYWLVPLRHEERKYLCAKLRGKFYAFLRTAQGSRGAPLTFAAAIALAARLVQSLVAGPKQWRRAREEARMQVYVDDPLVIMRASESRVKRLATMVIVGWMLLGFPLAFHKAVMAPTLTRSELKFRNLRSWNLSPSLTKFRRQMWWPRGSSELRLGRP